ncbi:MAG: ferredoxin [Methanoregula sp.]
MKVTIDRMQCVSCGSCWDACPALFVQNEEDTFSDIVSEFRDNGDPASSIALPDSVVDCAREAADLCPVQIIALVE